MNDLRVSAKQMQVLDCLTVRYGRLMARESGYGLTGVRGLVPRRTVRSMMRKGLVRWAGRAGRDLIDVVITEKGRAVAQLTAEQEAGRLARVEELGL